MLHNFILFLSRKLYYLKLELDKYWMVSRELGKCLPYSKVPPRVCRRKVGDKGGSLELGDLEETEMLQLLGNSSSNNTTDKVVNPGLCLFQQLFN